MEVTENALLTIPCLICYCFSYSYLFKHTTLSLNICFYLLTIIYRYTKTKKNKSIIVYFLYLQLQIYVNSYLKNIDLRLKISNMIGTYLNVCFSHQSANVHFFFNIQDTTYRLERGVDIICSDPASSSNCFRISKCWRFTCHLVAWRMLSAKLVFTALLMTVYYTVLKVKVSRWNRLAINSRSAIGCYVYWRLSN